MFYFVLDLSGLVVLVAGVDFDWFVLFEFAVVNNLVWVFGGVVSWVGWLCFTFCLLAGCFGYLFGFIVCWFDLLFRCTVASDFGYWLRLTGCYFGCIVWVFGFDCFLLTFGV